MNNQQRFRVGFVIKLGLRAFLLEYEVIFNRRIRIFCLEGNQNQIFLVKLRDDVT